MTVDDRARDFVRRTDAALAQPERAEELWTASVRSSTEEMRLHKLALDLDKAIRKVTGNFKAWSGLEASDVEAIHLNGPINLLWVIGAHPSGRVREAFVYETKHLPDDRILPHLANRSIDFVPAIRDLAAPLVMERLAASSSPGDGPNGPGLLPTPVHIAVTKLLAPRTAMLSPELLHACIDLAGSANMPWPRSLKGQGLNKMQERCRQTLDAASDAPNRKALEALIAYFANPPS